MVALKCYATPCCHAAVLMSELHQLIHDLLASKNTEVRQVNNITNNRRTQL